MEPADFRPYLRAEIDALRDLGRDPALADLKDKGEA